MPDMQKDLTQKQRESLREFLAVTLACGEEALAAIDRQIPMTQELFEQCMDACIAVNAAGQLDRLMTEYPELTNSFCERTQAWTGIDPASK